MVEGLLLTNDHITQFGGMDSQMSMTPTNRMISMAWRMGSANLYNAIVWFWGTAIL
jgi:hypothetical protein